MSKIFSEYSLVLREVKPGEFIIVSFNWISKKAGSVGLQSKEVLVRKKRTK